MQTFLPSFSFKQSAEWLDDRRLNKQIIEALAIYKTITENRKAWSNHPIVKMWKAYPEALVFYYNECLFQWKTVRGKNHKYEPIVPDNIEILGDIDNSVFLPSWLGDERIYSSHRANLLRKDYEFYSKYGWKENLMDYKKMPYYWAGIGYGKIPKDK